MERNNERSENGTVKRIIFKQKEMRKLLLAAIGATLLLSSCSKTFYQVYTTEAPGLNESNNALVYENEDCKVMYDLWSEDGNSGFVMYNKTDKDLYVMLPQTFFIKNGVAFDYFQNREYQNSQAVMSSSGVSTGIGVLGVTNIWGAWNTSKGNAKSTSTTVIHKENPMVCIPPHSSKGISEYVILSELIRNCEKKQAYPKKKSIPIEFTKEDTPLNFKNRITYSFNECGKESKSIENEFWISELTNYSEKEAGSMKMIKECDNDNAGVKVYKFKVSAPGKFYNSYRGFSVGGNKSNNKGELIYFD